MKLDFIKAIKDSNQRKKDIALGDAILEQDLSLVKKAIENGANLAGNFICSRPEVKMIESDVPEWNIFKGRTATFLEAAVYYCDRDIAKEVIFKSEIDLRESHKDIIEVALMNADKKSRESKFIALMLQANRADVDIVKKAEDGTYTTLLDRFEKLNKTVRDPFDKDKTEGLIEFIEQTLEGRRASYLEKFRKSLQPK